LAGAQLQQARSGGPGNGEGSRERLVAAIGRVVAEHGYAGFTVELALRYADVSRDAFEEHFETREQALLAAQEAYLDHIWLEVAFACDTLGGWPLKVRAAVAAVVTSLVDTSKLARAFGVEAAAASLVAADCQFAALDQFAAMLRSGRHLYPAAASLPEATERALVGGIASIVLDRLLDEDPGALLGLEPQLVELLLLPYLGEAEARRVAAIDSPLSLRRAPVRSG
jgi:AcrR family transcriptional regulator